MYQYIKPEVNNILNKISIKSNLKQYKSKEFNFNKTENFLPKQIYKQSKNFKKSKKKIKFKDS